jgi:hypothetical protein
MAPLVCSNPIEDMRLTSKKPTHSEEVYALAGQLSQLLLQIQLQELAMKSHSSMQS